MTFQTKNEPIITYSKQREVEFLLEVAFPILILKSNSVGTSSILFYCEDCKIFIGVGKHELFRGGMKLTETHN
jgi:hypothetical protein